MLAGQPLETTGTLAIRTALLHVPIDRLPEFRADLEKLPMSVEERERISKYLYEGQLERPAYQKLVLRGASLSEFIALTPHSTHTQRLMYIPKLSDQRATESLHDLEALPLANDEQGRAYRIILRGKQLKDMAFVKQLAERSTWAEFIDYIDGQIGDSRNKIFQAIPAKRLREYLAELDATDPAPETRRTFETDLLDAKLHHLMEERIALSYMPGSIFQDRVHAVPFGVMLAGLTWGQSYFSSLWAKVPLRVLLGMAALGVTMDAFQVFRKWKQRPRVDREIESTINRMVKSDLPTTTDQVIDPDRMSDRCKELHRKLRKWYPSYL